MRYFIDTEFYEDGTRIHPISIGIVAEDGRELYMEMLDFDIMKVPPRHYVLQYVLPLTYRHGMITSSHYKGDHAARVDLETVHLVNRRRAVKTLNEFLRGDTAPEFYGYFADYDWVLLAQLFGTMMDLPEHFPKWCRDLKQMAWERGRDATWIKEHVPQPAAAHNALEDARWCAQLYAKLTQSTDVRFLPAQGAAHGMFTAYDVPLEGIEVMAGALQAFLATPEGPQENDVSRGYRKVGQIMLDAMYRAKELSVGQPPRVTPAGL